MFDGFQGVLNSASMMPRDASLSDGSAPDSLLRELFNLYLVSKQKECDRTKNVFFDYKPNEILFDNQT